MKKELNFDFSETESSESAGPIEAEIVDKTPFDHFDIEKAKNFVPFLEIKAKLNAMRGKARDLKIKNEADQAVAMEMRIQIKALIRAADESKDAHPGYKLAAEFKTGLDKEIRDNLKKPLQEVDQILIPKIRFFQTSQAELKRRIDAKKAAEEAEKAKKEAEKQAAEEEARVKKEREDAIALQQKLNLEADNAGVERVNVLIPDPAKKEDILPDVETPVIQHHDKVEIDHGKATIEPVWVCTIIDPDKVPREFCSPDLDRIDKAIESGVRDIPGCKIEQSFDTNIRLSKRRKELNFKF